MRLLVSPAVLRCESEVQERASFAFCQSSFGLDQRVVAFDVDGEVASPFHVDLLVDEGGREACLAGTR
ncbi:MULTISPECIES: hypothetical protein [Rhodococcus]|uniref:hypothetical protein n=1 Tax=Rhodococcus TaxID=1827 RepID=UPI00110D50C2|nr:MULTISPECIES: hypothetical protein [Rhodococcus]